MVSDSLLGAVVDGRYVITRRIARGGMATVYRARDKRLERDVAIKLMHRHLAESPDFTARFNREARAAARLRRPGTSIVQKSLSPAAPAMKMQVSSSRP